MINQLIIDFKTGQIRPIKLWLKLIGDGITGPKCNDYYTEDLIDLTKNSYNIVIGNPYFVIHYGLSYLLSLF